MTRLSVSLLDVIRSTAHVRLVSVEPSFNNPSGDLVFAHRVTIHGLEVIRTKDNPSKPLYFNSDTEVDTCMEVTDYAGNTYKVEVTFPKVGIHTLLAYLLNEDGIL